MNTDDIVFAVIDYLTGLTWKYGVIGTELVNN